jgi:hypothetical protein
MRTFGLVAVVAGAGCFDPGSGPSTHDAAVDSAIDSSIIVTGCGEQRRPVVGTLLELDSMTAQPMPVAGAHIIAGAAIDAAAFTAGDGGFALCVPAADPVVMELDAPAGYLDGTIYIESAYEDIDLTLRTLGEARAATFYAERSLTYQGSKAHVLALNQFDRGQLTLDRAHDAAQAGDDDGGGGLAWSTTDEGRYVLFPNADTGAATATLSEPPALPDAIKDHMVPIAAGKLTIAAVAWAIGP